MKEEWKLIEGLEHHYISNTGRVRSVGAITVCKDGRIRHLKDKELKQHPHEFGYMMLHIKENGVKYGEKYVHRLVAKAFVDNPNNKPCVNHIDNNPANNRSDNLEWVTHQENTNWMAAQGRNKRTKKWLEHLHESQKKTYIPVIGRDIETGEEIRFDSINSVREGGFLPSMVCGCVKGRRKSHHGYTWKKA